MQVAQRDVDRDGHLVTGRLPHRGLLERVVEHGAGEAVHEPAPLGHRQERGRQQQPALGVTPPGEGLHADHQVGAEVDDRLEVHLDAVVVEGTAQARRASRGGCRRCRARTR